MPGQNCFALLQGIYHVFLSPSNPVSQYMDFYMNDVFQLTMESMNCGSDEIALQVVLRLKYILIKNRPSNSGQRFAMKKSTSPWRSQKQPSKIEHRLINQGWFKFRKQSRDIIF